MPAQHDHMNSRLARFVRVVGDDALLWPTRGDTGHPGDGRLAVVGETANPGTEENESRGFGIDEEWRECCSCYLGSGDVEIERFVEETAKIGSIC